MGVLATLVVLLIDASLHSRSPASGEALAGGAWIDHVLPVVTASTVDGRIISGIWADGLSMSGSAISSQVDQVATTSAQAYQQVLALRPPPDLEGPAGLLEACLYSRQEAAAELRAAFSKVLGAAVPGSHPSSTGPPPLQAVQAAGNDLQVGDQTYELFLQSMPAQFGVKMPPSVWLTTANAYQTQRVQVFLASLASAGNPAPVHEVKVYSVTPDPSAVSGGAIEVLPDATAITLTIVVADLGNQPERNLTVTASITPAGAGSSSVRDFIDLLPGQAYTIVGLGPLNPPQGVPVTLTVTVTPPPGSPTPAATETTLFKMPAQPPPTTTTTPATTSGSGG